MATEPATSSKQSKQDMQAHVRDYMGFTRLFLYGAIASFAIGMIVLFIMPTDPTRRMKIAVLKEPEGESRCAAIPETVKKFIALGADVTVESGAGAQASVSDKDFEDAGASTGSRADILKGAGIILCVTGPDPESLAGAAKGALLVGGLDPFRRRQAIDAYAKAGLDSLAMEWMPRITRAQSMDILSSQSNLAGYKAVIEAAGAYGRAFR